MAEQEKRVPTITEVEDWVNEYYINHYVPSHHNLPKTAFRIFLWPILNASMKLVPGPTAKIIMGIMPGHPQFAVTVSSAIDRIARQHLYSTMAVEKVAHIIERDTEQRRYLKERFNFEREMIPAMLGDEELSVRRVERIEVVHKPTGLREVIEHEQGSTFAARDIAKMRLARRVHEEMLKRQTPKVDNVLPFPASA